MRERPSAATRHVSGVAAAVHQAMAELAGHLALGLALGQRAAGRFQGVADDLAQGPVAAPVRTR